MSVLGTVRDLLWTQAAIREPLADSFLEGFAQCAISGWVLLGISFLVSPRIWGDLPADKRFLWHSTFVAAINPIWVGLAVWPEIWRAYRWLANGEGGDLRALEYAPTNGMYLATGRCCGYMFTDTLFMCIWYKELKKGMGGPLMMQMWIHHVCSIVAWPLALVSHRCILPLIYFVGTELSNPLLNTRWLLENHSKMNTTLLYAGVGIVFYLAYFVVRITPIPYLAYLLLQPSQYENYTALHLVFTLLLVPIPFFLNLYWFKLITRKFYRTAMAFMGMPLPEKAKKVQ